MKTSYDIIKSLLRTEKGTEILEPQRKYLFKAAISANKVEVKRAIEEIYNVRVEGVNTLRMHGKKKRVRYKEGRTPDWKKVVVTLKKDEKIDVA